LTFVHNVQLLIEVFAYRVTTPHSQVRPCPFPPLEALPWISLGRFWLRMNEVPWGWSPRSQPAIPEQRKELMQGWNSH